MILRIDAVLLDYLAVDGELRLCAQVADDVTHFDVKAQVLAVFHLQVGVVGANDELSGGAWQPSNNSY